MVFARASSTINGTKTTNTSNAADALTQSGSTTYAHGDGLGSIRLLTDGSGNPIGTAQHDAYGSTRCQTRGCVPAGTLVGTPLVCVC